MSLRTLFANRLLVFLFLFITKIVSAQYNAYGSASKKTGIGYNQRNCYTLTTNSRFQAGTVYSTTPLDLTNPFNIRIIANLGSKDSLGADGITFLFRQNPTVIPVGDVGGALGINNNGDSTLFIEIDTWSNRPADSSFDHICVMKNNSRHSGNISSLVPALPSYDNIEDNSDHELSISWDPISQDLKVYFDCFLRTTYHGDIVNNVFGGNPIVFYGASAATGGITNLHYICFEPKSIELPDTVHAICGDTLLIVQLSDTTVNCTSIDFDGTDFRLADSSKFDGTPGSVSFLGIKEATGINCNNQGKTNRIQIKLWKPIEYGDYSLIIKKGNNQNSLSPFCTLPDPIDYENFDIPEFTSVPVEVRGNITVHLEDTNKAKTDSNIAICIPQKNPFPLLVGNSPNAVQYHWTLNGDTIDGHNIPNLYANIAGTYEVLAKGPYGCPGSDKVNVYFPKTPEFIFDAPQYCDTSLFGDPTIIPDTIFAPDQPIGGTWNWEYDFGSPSGFVTIGKSKSIATTSTGIGTYRLTYTDVPAAVGVPGCTSEYTFTLNQDNFPPDARLNVDIFGDNIICETGDDAVLWIDEHILKPNFKAKPGEKPNTPYLYQWYDAAGIKIPGATDSSFARNEPGQYLVVVRDQYGCVGLDSITLETIPKQPSFEVFCEIIKDKKARFYWYDVPFASSYAVSTDRGVTWVPVQGTSFDVDDITSGIQVKAIMNNSCKESDISDSYPCAKKLLIPNVFTPNKDGLNETFSIQFLSLFPGSKVKVFNRWGMVVLESADYQNDWDGGDSPEGTYYYVINVNDPVQSVYKGVVTLLR